MILFYLAYQIFINCVNLTPGQDSLKPESHKKDQRFPV